jgi:ATP-dependent protease ClpP protease subunit
MTAQEAVDYGIVDHVFSKEMRTATPSPSSAT